jgi:hypothetical protein
VPVATGRVRFKLLPMRVFVDTGVHAVKFGELWST